jgi:hypothetical protein
MSVAETVEFAAACLNPTDDHSKLAAKLGEKLENGNATSATDGAELGKAHGIGCEGDDNTDESVSFREAVRQGNQNAFVPH